MVGVLTGLNNGRSTNRSGAAVARPTGAKRARGAAP